MNVKPRQIQLIQIHLSKKFTNRVDKLDFVSGFFNREVLSTKDLTYVEAEDLLFYLFNGKYKPNNWGLFDKEKSQHRAIMSRMHSIKWTKPSVKYGAVPDIERLSSFLKSPKSPVNKPLCDMNAAELSKIINAFDGILKSKFK